MAILTSYYVLLGQPRMSVDNFSGLAIYAIKNQDLPRRYYTLVKKAEIFNYGRSFGALLEALGFLCCSIRWERFMYYPPKR